MLQPPQPPGWSSNTQEAHSHHRAFAGALHSAWTALPPGIYLHASLSHPFQFSAQLILLIAPCRAEEEGHARHQSKPETFEMAEKQRGVQFDCLLRGTKINNSG